MNQILEKIFESVNPGLLRETGYTKYEILLMILMGHSTPMAGKLSQEVGKTFNSNTDIFKFELDVFPDKAKTIKSLFSNTKKQIKMTESIKVLANNLIEMFPKGKKPNTQLYWRGGAKEIAERLVKFFNEYGEFDHETILESAKIYVDSFDPYNRRYMQVLKYFIMKQKDSGFESNLYNMISNNNEGYTTAEDTYSDRFGMMMYAGKSNS